MVYVNHAAGLTLGEELISTHCKLCAVGKVISDRSLAANIVADLYRTGLDLEADLLELLLQEVIEENCQTIL